MISTEKKSVRRFLECSTLIAATCLIAGCNILNLGQTIFSQDAEDVHTPAALKTFTSKQNVSSVWSANLGSALQGTRAGLRPQLINGKIYAAGSAGTVSAFEATTGKVLWNSASGILISGGPGASNSLVVVGGLNGEAVALNAETGVEVWRKTLSSEVLAAPAVDSDYVAVRTADGRLTVLSAVDGSELWFDEQEVPRLSLRGNASPILIGGLLISPNDNGKIIAFNPSNGMIAWQSVLGIPRGRSELERLVDIDGNIEIIGTDIYAVGYQSRLGRIDGRSGRLSWAQKYSSVNGLGVDSSNVYLTTDKDTVVAVSQATGSELWKTEEMSYRSLTAPIYANGSLVLGDLEGYVHFLSPTDGSVQQRLRLSKAPIISAPLAVGSLVYIQSDDGKLAAYRVGE